MRVVKSGSEWFRVVQGGSGEWLRVVQSGSEWFRVVQGAFLRTRNGRSSNKTAPEMVSRAQKSALNRS